MSVTETAETIIQRPLCFTDDDEIVRDEIVDHLTRETLRKLIPKWQEPRHYFVDGLYARETAIEGDTVLVGKIHRRDGVSFLLRGSGWVWRTGDSATQMRAPCMYFARKRTRSVIYTAEPSLLVCVCATNKTTVAEAEADVYYKGVSDGS